MGGDSVHRPRPVNESQCHPVLSVVPTTLGCGHQPLPAEFIVTVDRVVAYALPPTPPVSRPAVSATREPNGSPSSPHSITALFAGALGAAFRLAPTGAIVTSGLATTLSPSLVAAQITSPTSSQPVTSVTQANAMDEFQRPATPNQAPLSLSLRSSGGQQRGEE